MALTESSVCEFGREAIDFQLPGTDGKTWSLSDCKGEKATLVMFICNHCPYVQAILPRLLDDVRGLKDIGVGSVAIMPNDIESYPEDSFDNMTALARQRDFPFPYLLDDTQETARAYGAVCTPDFFGYNADLQLQFRGRLDAGGIQPAPAGAPRELSEAMRQIAATGRGPERQFPSMGCSIKWRS